MPMTRGFRDCRMFHQSALDFEGSDQVAGGLDHIVRAADKPVIAVRVAPGQVAGQIPAAREALRVALRCVRDRPRNIDGQPRPQRQFSLAVRFLDHYGHAPSCCARRWPPRCPGNGRPIEPGRMSMQAKLAIMMPPVSVCHQLSWNGRPKVLRAPQHRLGIQRFADAGQEAQRLEIRTCAAARVPPSSACGSPWAPCTRR